MPWPLALFQEMPEENLSISAIVLEHTWFLFWCTWNYKSVISEFGYLAVELNMRVINMTFFLIKFYHPNIQLFLGTKYFSIIFRHSVTVRHKYFSIILYWH